MSQKDLLENQVIEEILREKSSYYAAQNKIPDYWILVSPKFIQEKNLSDKLKQTKFFENQKNKIIHSFNNDLKIEFYASLISSDKDFMNWIKLRLGYFEDLNSNEKIITNNSYMSDGVCGIYPIEGSLNLNSCLLSNQNLIHPDITCNKINNLIKNFY
jgi:hypothetical protein